MNLNRIYHILFLVVTFILFSCREETPEYKKTTDEKEWERIFLVRNPKYEVLDINPLQEEKSITIGVGYGGLKLPAYDIKVTLAVDSKALDSINKARVASEEEEYSRFPEGSYTLDKTEVTIPAGKTYSDYIKLTYNPKVFDYNKSYILPISIVDASGYKLSKAKTITLKVPKVDKFIPISPLNWAVSFSSEETIGEGTNNGRAIHSIDGDVETFWHSQWYGVSTKYPHWLSYDMKKQNYVSKIAIYPRHNNANGVTKFKVEGSVDGNTWALLSDEVLDFDPALREFQEYELRNPKEIQYIKVTFIEGRRKQAFIGEFKVYTTPEALRN